MTHATVLITGTSGSIGAALADSLADAGVELHLLRHRTPVHAPRGAMVHNGDLTEPDLGLNLQSGGVLRRHLTGILHCASLTDFSISRLAAEEANVRGTRNLLRFAVQCDRIDRIGLLSTIYVAGKRRGRITENELSHRAGFVNEYERSKYRMEQSARRFRRILPISIYRLSTILGRENGEVVGWGAVHNALRLFYNGWIPMVPGESGSTVDLISLDYATAAVEELFLRRFEAGTTFQIAAGRGAVVALDRFLRLTGEIFQSEDSRWSRRGIEAPPIVPLSTFRHLEETVRQTGDIFLGRTLEIMSRFVPQLAYPKTFEVKEATRHLDGSGIAAVPLGQWLPAVLRHCLATKWGRGVSNAIAEAG